MRLPLAVNKESFGRLADGTEARLYSLSAGGRVCVKLTDFGAAVTSILMPDADGHIDDVVLGFDDVSGYEADDCFIGATVGRYANRIAGGNLEIDGTRYSLACNNPPNHLHGGARGFNKYIWQSEGFDAEGAVGVRFWRQSPHLEEGYPGNLDISLTVTLFADDRIRFEYCATTDRATVVNLTNHSYFNLAGGGNILDHEVSIEAESYLPVDAGSIPLASASLVAGTPFDFRAPVRVGPRLNAEDAQIMQASGFDHNFILCDNRRELKPAASVSHKPSGRCLSVSTTEPGVQFYSGNFLNDVAGREGRIYGPHAALCLEPQLFPGSPARPDFPSAILLPQESYRHISEFKFTLGAP